MCEATLPGELNTFYARCDKGRLSGQSPEDWKLSVSTGHDSGTTHCNWILDFLTHRPQMVQLAVTPPPLERTTELPRAVSSAPYCSCIPTTVIAYM
ncbi:hypothetical protein L3Q82_024578 [Scortum barcoo]|uniref:Uncharacterized protein n=1 Tax=Scortum barcoo TaxID=214431 RepID=A0ACB8WNY2_9TELE|nr:hypothetical protein L3Q82_024578 [Scortum barcoo]